MNNNDILIKIGADISELTSGMRTAQDQIAGLGSATEASADKGAFSIGKLIAGVGGVALLSKGFGMLKESVGSAFSRIDTMESFERVMTELTGSTDQASAALDKTRDSVTGTAYGLDTAAKSVQDFVTRGMSVDKATDTMAAWGDAVAFYGDGSNEQLANVSDALAKMVSSGKVGMDQMNRLYDAGIDGPGMYAKATGMSAEEVKKNLSNGSITAEDFIDTVSTAMMEGTNGVTNIAGAAKEAGASWGASFDNMKAAVTRGTIGIIQGIDEMLTTNGLPDMRQMIADFGSKFEDVLGKVATFIPPVAKALASIYESLKPWMPLITAIVIGIGSFIAITSTVTKVIAVWAAVKKAILAVNAVMMANPYVLAIAAIIAFAFLVYKYWDEIVAYTSAIWNGIKEFFSALWSSITSVASAAWASFMVMITGIWQSIVDMATTIWNAVSTAIMVVVGPIVTYVMQQFNTMKEGISGIFNGLVVFFTGIWNVIKTVFLGSILMIYNLLTGNFEAMKSDAVGILNSLANGIKQIWEGIKAIFKSAVVMIVNLVKNYFNTVKSTITSISESIKTTISNIWNSIKTFFSTTLADIVSSVKTKFSEMVVAIATKMAEVVTKVKDGWDGAMKFLKGIDLTQIGKDIIQGLINGIISTGKKIGETVANIVNKIPEGIRSILGMASPSKVTAKLGVYTGQGLVNGMYDMKNKVAKAAEQMAQWATPDTNKIAPIGFDGGAAAMATGSYRAEQDIQHTIAERHEQAKKPANINLVLGGRDYETFVEDIDGNIKRKARLKRKTTGRE